MKFNQTGKEENLKKFRCPNNTFLEIVQYTHRCIFTQLSISFQRIPEMSLEVHYAAQNSWFLVGFSVTSIRKEAEGLHEMPRDGHGQRIIKPPGNGTGGTVGRAGRRHTLTHAVMRRVSSSVDIEPCLQTMRRNGLSQSSNVSLSDLGKMFTPMVML